MKNSPMPVRGMLLPFLQSLSFLKQEIVISFVLLLLLFGKLNAATIYFNTAYIGSGNSYGLNTSSISGITNVTGNGFEFTSTNPSDIQFVSTGNNVTGTFSYLNTSGIIVSMTGTVSRIFKSGNTTDGLYFLVDGTGVAYNLVIPGRESQFTTGQNYNSAGNSALADMNALLTSQNAQSVISVSDATVAEGAGYINFTVSFSNNSTRTVTNSFTPTLTTISATIGTDISSTMQYSFNGSTWTTLTSSISVTTAQSSLQIRVAVTDDITPECAETFTINTGTISGVGILNNAGTFGTGTINDNNDPLIWNGTTSTDWNYASNWTPNLLPQTCYTISIPASLSRYPVLTATSTISSLQIATGASLNLSSFSINITDNLINNGIISGNGTVVMNGSVAQTISGNGTTSNMNINNSAGVVIASGSSNMLNITGIITPQNGTLTTNGNLTLKCSVSSVGMIGVVTGAIVGNVITERCIPAGNRAYRFVGSAVSTSSSIHANWQEGATAATHNPQPGYGTHITGTLIDQTNGLDATITGNPSLYSFNNQTQSWVTITNTNTNTLKIGNPFRILIRGDRAHNLNIEPSTNTATILRSTGFVATGTITFGTASSTPTELPLLASNINAYSFIANPYPSSVNWSTISKTGITGYYYVWDPNLGTRGSYVSCYTDGTKSNSSSAITTAIQSGQGFFVQNTSVADTRQLVFNETDKTNGITNVFRTNTTNGKIEIQLFRTSILNSGGTSQDGALVLLNDNFTNNVDGEDATKISNLDENIAIVRGADVLSIERRRISFTLSDTVALKLWQTIATDYSFRIALSDLDANTIIILKDNFLNTETPLLVNVDNIISFRITDDVLSKASDRFSIILKNNNALASQFLWIKAIKNSTYASVQWATQNDEDVSLYEVEKSINGSDFVIVGKVVKSATKMYSWNDDVTNNFTTYYRIKATTKTGVLYHSSVVMLKNGSTKKDIELIANPVINNQLSLFFANMDNANYNVKIVNNIGQVIFSSNIKHLGNSALYNLPLDINHYGFNRLIITSNNFSWSKPILIE